MRGCTQDKDACLRRLRRIEGQVRGMARMVALASAAVKSVSAKEAGHIAPLSRFAAPRPSPPSANGSGNKT